VSIALAAKLRRPLTGYLVGLGEAEAHPDRVQLVDRGEEAARGVGGDEAADRALRAPGDAGDRRRHLRVRQVEARLAHLRVGLLHAGAAELLGGQRVVVFLLAHRLVGDQAAKPRLVARRLGELRALLRERGFGFGQRHLVGCSVDLEHRRARTDGVALAVELL
jgi:hypothetical protein